MRLLHISDIHFGIGREGDPKHVFTNAGKSDPKALAASLAKLKKTDPPDLIVASGDVGWSGAREDYDDALVFFRALRDSMSVPVLVVAGNHDVNRGPGVAAERRQDEFIRFIRELYSADVATWYPLLDDAACGLSERERLIAVYRNDSLRLCVIGINSASSLNGWEHCTECGRRSAATTGMSCPECGIIKPTANSPIAVERAVAAAVDKVLQKLPQAELWFRVLVLHHHLFPFEEPARSGHVDTRRPPSSVDTEIVTNSTALHAWTGRAGFQLVLHGHKHQPNGRVDVLYRRDDPAGQKIFVLGAGSTGVVPSDRGAEPLGFFIIEADRLSDSRFEVLAKPMRIATGSLIPNVLEDFPAFPCEVGPHVPAPPPLFYAENLVDCHAAIARATSRSKSRLLRSFVSIVEVGSPATFEFPDTVRRAGREVSLQLIEASFLALHPEYDQKNRTWGSAHDVTERLRRMRPRFQFSHGPRMFGHGRMRTSHPQQDERSLLTPMHSILQTLVQNPSTSHAFVGVFDPSLDSRTTGQRRATGQRRGPPPTLTGVQFHIDADVNHLELTLTFRKLDLAFWWAVNMYEAMELWNWTQREIKREVCCNSGRITFFATLAEWKKDDTATFVIPLDDMPIESMVELALAADAGDGRRLRESLRQKRERTNINNIDSYGIEQLSSVVQGILRSNVSVKHWNAELQQKLAAARDALRSAEEQALAGEEGAAERQLQAAADALSAVEAAF